MSFNPLISVGDASVIAPNSPGAVAGTLAAATPVSLDYDCSTASRVIFVISNTGGSNAIGTVTVKKSPNGTTFGTDTALGTAIGSIAANGSVIVELTDCAFSTLRITMTSASGSTYAVALRGVR